MVRARSGALHCFHVAAPGLDSVWDSEQQFQLYPHKTRPVSQCHSSAGSLLHLTADTALQVMPCAGNWLIQVNPPLTLSTCSNEDRNCCLHVAQCAGSLKGLLGERGAKVSVSTHSGFAKEARGKKSPRHCSLISVCCWMDVRAAGRASAAEHLPAPGEEVLFCMRN